MSRFNGRSSLPGVTPDDRGIVLSRLNRRQWLALPLAACAAACVWNRRGQARPLPEMTAQSAPLLTGSHVGFRPDARKRIFVRNGNLPPHAQLSISGPTGASRVIPLMAESAGKSVSGGAANRALLDSCANPVSFDDIRAEGTYSASVGAGVPFSFRVARDAWLSVLPTLAGYAHYQRCGHSDRSVHPDCHLDDAKRRDNHARVDTTGGWHDAGDLRKWVDATLMNLFGLTALARNMKTLPASGPLSLHALLDEAKYGNIFFLKMQDSDGLVWADVGGGVHGDNSDNHWTDNLPDTADDRWINTEKRSGIQAMFIAAQAIMAQLFSQNSFAKDPDYAATCLSAAVRCWKASAHQGGNTTDIAWWTIAAVEMSAATAQPACVQEMTRLANQLASLQIKNPVSASPVTGFFSMWTGGEQPLRDAVHSGLPAFALLHASRSRAAASADAKNWAAAAQLYIDGYAAPMTSYSVYGVMPFGLFLDAGHDENYRPLSGRYSFRFFMPTKNAGYSGLSSHLLSHALLFAEAERCLGDSSYRDMAYAHLEWVFGANPFGASLVTGAGSNQPPAFSPFVGLIPGGIMNGIAGNENDEAVLNQESAKDWHTNEYWSPHSGYCLWALSVLEGDSA